MRWLIFIVLSGVYSPLWGVSVDQSAPLFSLQEMRNGGEIELQNYQGKVVYLDFWASWCIPCRRSFPALTDLYQRYRDQGFEVIAVNLDEDKEAALEFIAQYPATYSLAFGFDTEVSKQYAVKVMPTAYFIDATGKIRLIHLGFKDEQVDFLEAVLQKLLAER